MIGQAAPLTCWRAYPAPESSEQVDAAVAVFWQEYAALTEWTATQGLPQPSIDDFLEMIALAWNDLAAWQPVGPPQ